MMARDYHLERDDENTKATAICDITGNPYSVTVPTEQFDAWRDGELIQKAMPTLDREQREFLISGTTPAEWKALAMTRDDDDRTVIKNEHERGMGM